MTRDPDDDLPLIARVAVDVPLAHLDRPFDYLVTPAQRDQIAVGCRVRVRFAGRLRDGFVVGLGSQTDVTGELATLERVVSPEVVLTPAVDALIRAVADHYAGTWADVARLAVPPRHARTEQAEAPARPAPRASGAPGVLAHYPDGATFLDAVAHGRPVRATWTPAPAFGKGSPGDWAGGLVDAVVAAVRAGRGAIVVVPGAAEVAEAAQRLGAVVGEAAVVTLTSDLGPAQRYRNFLAVSRGHATVVVGTRPAVFAPVAELGLIAVWDEGNDLLAEPRAPYPHVREVAALRASLEPSALLLAGYGRTAEVQALVERGWLVPVALPPTENRRVSAAVRVAVASDHDLERDPHARAARLPHQGFATIRDGLVRGPVLVQVPRTGYVTALACGACGLPTACPTCGRTLGADRRAGGIAPACGWCGPLRGPWRCASCGSTRLRAPGVGVRRTAEELGRAFPGVPVVQSWSGHVVDRVTDELALVLATPGAEPVPAAGYAAAVLLDAHVLLGRPSLRAAEEALRRWLAVCAAVLPAEAGGTVTVVGESDARAIQALVRLDAPGFAARELADREASGLPPAAKVVELLGTAVDDYADAWQGIGQVEAFGPLPVGKGETRVTLRVPLERGAELVAAIKRASASRAQRKSPGVVRVRVDPVELG